jgi:hypothetical protein
MTGEELPPPYWGQLTKGEKAMIKKMNLDPSLVNWLMTTTGLGPGIGDVFYVAPAASSSSQYRTWWQGMGIDESHLFLTVKEAYNAAVTDRNDVILKAPGIETVTAELDWEKNRTHLIGLGGPQQKGYESGTGLYSSTITVANVLHNTGVNNQFHNITVMNAGANATCLSAFKNAGYGTRLIGSQIIGCAAATQAATALANSLAIASGGYYFYAENCNIGSTDYGTLGANTACHILFEADGMSSDGTFKNCNISATIDATTRTLIYIGTNGIDRDWVFDNCTFYAFSANHAYVMTQVVTNQAAVPSTYDMAFHNCLAINCTEFRTDSNGCTWVTGSAANGKGGIAVVAT